MLSKKYRLTTKDFELFGQGKTSLFSCNLFSLFARFDNTLQTPKFGFVVSKKCDSRAVYRNRVKRLLSRAIERSLVSIDTGFAKTTDRRYPVILGSEATPESEVNRGSGVDSGQARMTEIAKRKKGWFVFYAKKDIITANHEELFNLVDKAISKIPVI